MSERKYALGGFVLPLAVEWDGRLCYARDAKGRVVKWFTSGAMARAFVARQNADPKEKQPCSPP